MRAVITEENVQKFLEIYGVKEQGLFGDDIKHHQKEIIINEVFQAFSKCYKQGKKEQFKTKYRVAGYWKEHVFDKVPEYQNFSSTKELTESLVKHQVARDTIVKEDRDKYFEKKKQLEKSRNEQEQDKSIER